MHTRRHAHKLTQLVSPGRRVRCCCCCQTHTVARIPSAPDGHTVDRLGQAGAHLAFRGSLCRSTAAVGERSTRECAGTRNRSIMIAANRSGCGVCSRRTGTQRSGNEAAPASTRSFSLSKFSRSGGVQESRVSFSLPLVFSFSLSRFLSVARAHSSVHSRAQRASSRVPGTTHSIGVDADHSRSGSPARSRGQRSAEGYEKTKWGRHDHRIA